MRVLLDECMPRRLKQELQGHDVRTVPEVGGLAKRTENCCGWLKEILTSFLPLTEVSPNSKV